MIVNQGDGWGVSTERGEQFSLDVKDRLDIQAKLSLEVTKEVIQ